MSAASASARPRAFDVFLLALLLAIRDLWQFEQNIPWLILAYRKSSTVFLQLLQRKQPRWKV